MAGTADESPSHLCGINACGNWPSGGHTRSWRTLSAVWRGSSCTGHCQVYWRTPRTSKGSWYQARNGEESLKKAGEEEILICQFCMMLFLQNPVLCIVRYLHLSVMSYILHTSVYKLLIASKEFMAAWKNSVVFPNVWHKLPTNCCS